VIFVSAPNSAPTTQNTTYRVFTSIFDIRLNRPALMPGAFPCGRAAGVSEGRLILQQWPLKQAGMGQFWD
jgi:hypothetical protein